MKSSVFLLLALLWGLGAILPLDGQVEFIRRNYFPADGEFAELRSVLKDLFLDNKEDLTKVLESALYSEVGFVKYARRDYALATGDALSAETVTLKDARAAYSVLTLSRTANIVNGPPGDFLASDGNSLLFCQANIFVRIRCAAQGDLARRLAISVSNRIGRHNPAPLLISHFPKDGYDASTLRYFLGPESLAKYSRPIGGRGLRFQDEVEIAQAQYRIESENATLSLIGFPTGQSADSYLEMVVGSLPGAAASGEQVYCKRSGPILSILAGDMKSATAARILGGIQFTYSIKWIYDKRNSESGNLLGVSLGILGTVVRSLFLTFLLCGASVVVGVLFGFFRIFLRGYAPNNIFDRPDRTGTIRLRLGK